jgi:hypothetical protein
MVTRKLSKKLHRKERNGIEWIGNGKKVCEWKKEWNRGVRSGSAVDW